MNGLFSYLMSEVAALESRLCRFRSLFLRERRVSPWRPERPFAPGFRPRAARRPRGPPAVPTRPLSFHSSGLPGILGNLGWKVVGTRPLRVPPSGLVGAVGAEPDSGK